MSVTQHTEKGLDLSAALDKGFKWPDVFVLKKGNSLLLAELLCSNGHLGGLETVLREYVENHVPQGLATEMSEAIRTQDKSYIEAHRGVPEK